eukprot:TRINITY_DN67781_c4_g3_i1.p1 TRINITY_DN67781_c4_g3~~TRINITY_DN67781_c4_g3_i1.p1  ORF type:complete len:315 (+),score=53.99 TRINITY_DN67781_c4_g3_i1:114-1058(+)
MQNYHETVNLTTNEGKRSKTYDGTRDVKDLAAGDTFYIAKFLKARDLDQLFSDVLKESNFQVMFHFSEGGQDATPIPRLVTAQTMKGKCRAPIYRMPGCNQKNIPTTPWTPTVSAICDKASERIGQDLNHCVVTLFRDQDDSLGFHQDKLLDLNEGSLILSISLGQARPIVFSSNDGRRTHRVLLQPGSLLAIGPQTNKQWKHAIPKVREQVGPRVSLSVRSISTFMDQHTGAILGKGQEFQDKNYPFTTNHDDETQYPPELAHKMGDLTAEALAVLKDLRYTHDPANWVDDEMDADYSSSSGQEEVGELTTLN